MAQSEVRKPFNATEYCETVIKKMEKDPGNHGLWARLVSAVNAPCVVIPGLTGGGTELALKTLTRLNEIHQPVCEVYPERHQIASASRRNL